MHHSLFHHINLFPDMNHHARSPPLLHRAHVHCPVTALAVLRLSSHGSDDDDDDNSKLCVLSGEDTHLQIRDPATSRLCASVRVFSSQAIQGIDSLAGSAEDGSSSSSGGGGDLLVWGGPCVAVISRARIWSLLSEQRGLMNGSSASASASGEPSAAAVLPSLVLSRDETLRAPDWIYHASLSPTAAPSPSLGTVVTAHNEVLPLHVARVPGTERRSLRWGRVRAPPSSRPILYSAQVRWTGAEEVLVAAGTAFGEIVVWRCRVDDDDDDDDDEFADEVEVLYVFSGHEGSIFGVDISPEIIPHAGPRTTTTTTTRLLASCSDDRTIRVWDISEAASGSSSRTTTTPAERREQQQQRQEKRFPRARETGFGENAPSELEASARHVSSKPWAMAMGHVSRIWNVRFAPPPSSSVGPAGGLALYSFGEDATAQRWRLEFDDKAGIAARLDEGARECATTSAVASLTHEAIIHRHSGKHIWSSSVSGIGTPTQQKVLVVTGGSDGKINIVEEMVSPEKDNLAVMLDISGSEVARSLSVSQTGLNGTAKTEDAALATQSAGRGQAAIEGPFLMYALLSDGSIIATTSAGRIFCGSLRGNEVSWTEIQLSKPHQEDLRRYQIVRSVGTSTVLFGSTSGHLYVYHGDCIRQIYKAPGKIADIFPLPVDILQGCGIESAVSPPPLIPIIVSTMGSSQVRLLVLDVLSENAIQQECLIELEKGFIITAAGHCRGHLIFGSRSGAMLIYKPAPGGQGGHERIARVDRPFTKDSVASIIHLPSKAGVPSPYFLTTSRDGRYRIYEIMTEINTNKVDIHLRHEAQPALGPLIESALFTPSSPTAKPELILAGFRSRSFIVWNETRQLELANVECGGGHRAFTYRVDPERPEKLSFVWTQAARTRVYSQTGLPQATVKRGGHGREIKAVAACSGSGGLLATGAEDTTVRIWRYRPGAAEDVADDDNDDDGLQCLAVVEKHTAGIQCLRWAGENYLISSSGNEELFVWRVTRLGGSDYEGPAVVCEGAYPDKTRDGDLRITSFDVEVLPTEGPEASGEEVLCLSLALSNSTLKTYRYSRAAGFVLLAEGRYTGACPMQIRHLRAIASEQDEEVEVHVLTASTDGHVALWRTSSALASGPGTTAREHVLVEACRLHQSGLKALDLHALDGSCTQACSYALLTGGDDNALGHARLDWVKEETGGGRFTVSARSLAGGGAHAAAVTGLCVLDVAADRRGVYRVGLCTASNDQRIRAWRMEVDAGGRVGRVALVGDRYSAVADCGDLERLGAGGDGRRAFVVVGVGMEVWRVCEPAT